MNTVCTRNNNIIQLTFQTLGKKKVEAKFDRGMITSDVGAIGDFFVNVYLGTTGKEPVSSIPPSKTRQW